MTNDKGRELRALVHLVDEPDSEMFEIIRKRIIEHGHVILPFLKEELNNTFQPEIISRLKELIKIINIDYIKNEFHIWKQMGAGNLLHGLYLVAKYNYEFLEIDEIKKNIAELEHDIWIEMNDRLTLLEKIKVFNHVFYNIHGFKPNRADFHNPSNSFINDVLTKKTGNPILMAGVYIIIAQRIGLPVYGVNVPEHFICVVVNDNSHENFSFLPIGEPLFYINAFNYGDLFTKVQLANFLYQIKAEDKPEYYLPCSNIDIILRVLNNLSYSFGKLNEHQKVKEIEELKLSLQ